ncbi:flagellar hook protein FlgE [Puniceibacterium sediminis]|uniref:Flagellar hook protein FlgE n=1 Tax=Puniceibacterium sediminis TaxID=1608407 RepID=A0A238VTE0_9RHOB|nr:flagellar hook-basal body complex protein [Puniceibacterium sediminis]SNR37063.1 flagellar hook protein FlgE [Puniceibacterium sediminis]
MTISSSLSAGVAGLASNASRLATISDNIANSSTYGYKRVETDFQSMVTASGGGKYTAGGVRAGTQRLVDKSGSLISTSNATDLAISGGGFLPVASMNEVSNANGNPQMFMTTTGSFRTNAEGYLVTESGLVLMGFPAAADGTIPSYPRDSSDGLEPIQINMNQLTGVPTTQMSLGINLPASDTYFDASGDPQDVSVGYYDNLGVSETFDVTFTPTIPPSGASNAWTMVITDSAQASAVVGEYTLTFTDSRTAGGNLATVGTTSGGIYDGTTGTVIVNAASGPIEISIGMLGSSDGLTQLGYSFAPLNITKDGSAVGSMTSVEVDALGMVNAIFDTGLQRTIYQVPLIDLPNPNGLIAMDNQVYMASPESGAYYLWNAAEGPVGDIASFAREESTTDVAKELTDLIQTQRAYSSNAKVIQTVDEMLQETTNIKR